ncbi:flagellar basal body P-ring formation chaperone FlgA [Catenovulum sp. 2E275]|uniref:flagellar basal body P-ring formation chaperone FlgA n=1 Tax=Catenovulum sp. 2E275 TaxID=2980497 RepID=UPI0021D1F0A8|nr:flagellar basal body P-ring formation chaperone FlgA [Catenovulum sp. 2E275]MCU4676440.1 flagellar basal body P-ring formation chaperone FlgA [Catenovulum sp. 2E275]
MKTTIAWLFTSLTLFSGHSLATQYTKKQIEQLAAEHVESIYPAQADETLKAYASEIDSRLNINPCNGELVAEVPNFNAYSRHMTVKVKCNADSEWILYVPVQVKIMTPVIVASQYIESGQTISESDVQVQLLEKNRSRSGFIADKKTIIGSKAKRQIKSGQAIISRNICFVCRGEMVTIEAVTSGLSVKASGVAMADATYGETVSVRNTSSNRIIQGRVSSVGEVQIFL